MKHFQTYFVKISEKKRYVANPEKNTVSKLSEKYLHLSGIAMFFIEVSFTKLCPK